MKILIVNSDKVIEGVNNFLYSEIFRASTSSMPFNFPLELIKGAQLIRDMINEPLLITCAYSTKYKFGYHRLFMALDVVPERYFFRKEFMQHMDKSCRDYLNGKTDNIIRDLRLLGITGFGIERDCFHMDLRPIKDIIWCRDTHIDDYGQYQVFEFFYHFSKTGEMIIDINRLV